MNRTSLIALTCVIQLGSCTIYAQGFTVKNSSQLQGIYLEYNETSSVTSFPSGCTKAPGSNAYCCKFKTGNSANFQISGNANFNIAVGACGSSGTSVQAEFNINSSGACGDRGKKCDWVDVSTVQNPPTPPDVTITPSDGSTPINNANQNSCGVYRTGAQDCAKAPTKDTQCYANNFCHNIYKPQDYTIDFQ